MILFRKIFLKENFKKKQRMMALQLIPGLPWNRIIRWRMWKRGQIYGVSGDRSRTIPRRETSLFRVGCQWVAAHSPGKIRNKIREQKAPLFVLQSSLHSAMQLRGNISPRRHWPRRSCHRSRNPERRSHHWGKQHHYRSNDHYRAAGNTRPLPSSVLFSTAFSC